MGRVGRGYLLGGRVELFWFDSTCFTTAMATFSSSAMTTTISTTTFNSPPPGIYFEATNQAETQNNVSTDSVQMRIIDFFPFFLHEPPMHRFMTFPFILFLTIPIVHAVKALRSFTPFEGPSYEGLYYLLITFIHHGVQCIHHAVHTRYIHPSTFILF